MGQQYISLIVKSTLRYDYFIVQVLYSMTTLLYKYFIEWLLYCTSTL